MASSPSTKRAARARGPIAPAAVGVLLALASASSWAQHAARARLLQTFPLSKHNSRFNYEGGLAFVDDDRFAIVQVCEENLHEPAVLLGRVSDGGRPKGSQRLKDCDLIKFDETGVAVAQATETADGHSFKVDRYPVLGPALPTLEAPPGFSVNNVLHVSPASLVLLGRSRTPDLSVALDPRELAVLSSGSPAKVFTVPEEDRPIASFVEGSDLWVATMQSYPGFLARLYHWRLDSNGAPTRVDVPNTCQALFPVRGGFLCGTVREGGTNVISMLQTDGSVMWKQEIEGSLATPIAISGDRTRIAAVRDDGLTVISLDGSKRAVRTAKDSSYTAIALSRTGKYALLGRQDGSVQLWSLQ